MIRNAQTRQALGVAADFGLAAAIALAAREASKEWEGLGLQSLGFGVLRLS